MRNNFEQKNKNSLKTDTYMKTNDRRIKILSGLAAVAIGCLCCFTASSQPATQSPQLQEVVKLTQAKMSDDVILQYVKNSGASYNLSADDILYLNTQGVSQPVISALLASKGTTSVPVAVPPPSPAPIAVPSTPAPPVSPYPGAPVSPYPGQPAVSVVVAPSEPPPGSDMSLSYFQGQLSPYGQWVDVPGQGLCWVPSVQAAVPDWRPYFNEGRWIYTDDGWSWQSDYPWGEYAFHYGRWFRDARFGWMWRPGYHWGPAWVSWRHAEGEGFCGWAPLPPAAIFEPGVGLMWDGRVAVDVDFGLAPDMFVFMPFDHFWAHDYLAFRAPIWRSRDLFRVSLVVNHYGFVGGRFVVGGIGRDRMAVLTHHDVRVETLHIRDEHITRSREIEHAHVPVAHAPALHAPAVHGTDLHGADLHGADHGRPAVGHDDARGSLSRDHDSHDGHDGH
jgi:hypothetical protein